MNTKFKAFVVREAENGVFKSAVEERKVDDLPIGDILIRVFFSSINYKDALSASGNKGVSKNYPHTPCLLYTSPSPRDGLLSRMPSSA